MSEALNQSAFGRSWQDPRGRVSRKGVCNFAMQCARISVSHIAKWGSRWTGSISTEALSIAEQFAPPALLDVGSSRELATASFSATHRSQGAASLGVRHDLCPTPMEPKNNKTSFEASKISKHAKWQCVGRSAWLSFERRSRGNHNRRSPIVSETEELRWSPQTI